MWTQSAVWPTYNQHEQEFQGVWGRKGKAMFQTVEDNFVANLDGVREGYTKRRENGFWCLQINVGAEHIDRLFRMLCGQVCQPSFLLLEHGTNQKEEETLRTSENAPFHKDVFYWNNPDYPKFEEIYDNYKELLIQDGEISFGLGSHTGIDEVYVGPPHKIFAVLTETPEKYEPILRKFNFPLLKEMKTVRNVFSRENPGQRRCVRKNGIDIYDMIGELTAQGLYLAERREEE